MYLFFNDEMYEADEKNVEKSNVIKNTGIINHINDDKTYDITYDDGEFDFNVKESQISTNDHKKIRSPCNKFDNLIGTDIKITHKDDILTCRILDVDTSSSLTLKYGNYIISNYNDEYKPVSKKNVKGKFSVGQKVIVSRSAININILQKIYNEEENYYCYGKVIHFNFSKKKAITQILWSKELVFPLKIDISYKYDKNEKVIYLDEEKVKNNGKPNKCYSVGYVEGEKDTYNYNIKPCNENGEKIEDKNIVVKNKNIYPYAAKHYCILEKVIVHVENIGLPGIVLNRFSHDNSYLYQVLLPSGHVLKNVTQNNISKYNLYQDVETFYVTSDENKVISGNVNDFDEDCKFILITPIGEKHKELMLSDLKIKNDYGITIGSRVLVKFNVGYYPGIVSNISFPCYSILFDDGEYKSMINYCNVVPYYDEKNLFEVGEQIIDVEGKKGVINKINGKKYDILYDDQTYAENVDLSKIKRIFNRLNYVYGDEVALKDDTKVYIIRNSHFVDGTYIYFIFIVMMLKVNLKRIK